MEEDWLSCGLQTLNMMVKNRRKYLTNKVLPVSVKQWRIEGNNKKKNKFKLLINNIGNSTKMHHNKLKDLKSKDWRNKKKAK